MTNLKTDIVRRRGNVIDTAVLDVPEHSVEVAIGQLFALMVDPLKKPYMSKKRRRGTTEWTRLA